MIDVVVVLELQGIVANKFDSDIVGIARVVTSETINEFVAGEILIAESTNPDFLSAMLKAKAIITEMGGLLSHSAIISREFNIPCVIGVKEVTTKITTGRKIIIKTNGVVYVED